MPDNLGGTASRPTTNLHLVPPRPVATRRPSLLAVLAEASCSLWQRFCAWLDGHVSYEEIERKRMQWVTTGYCLDCECYEVVTDGVHCHVCGSRSVMDLRSVWMEREDA